MPSPSSIMIGTRIMVAIIERWNITLDMIASVKYFCLKCWNSTKGCETRRSTKMNTTSSAIVNPCIGRW